VEGSGLGVSVHELEATAITPNNKQRTAFMLQLSGSIVPRVAVQVIDTENQGEQLPSHEVEAISTSGSVFPISASSVIRLDGADARSWR
jgi:hypothetical protein